MTEKIAFRMQLKPGHLAEYRRRHDEIWPDLAALLNAAGISDYSIFHDPASDTLFATLRRTTPHGMDQLPQHELMRSWWHFMAPLMETNPDGSPVSHPLQEIFHLA